MGWCIETDGKVDPRRFKDQIEASEALAQDLKAGKFRGKNIRLREATAVLENTQPVDICCMIISFGIAVGLLAVTVKALCESISHCLKTGDFILLAANWFCPPVGVIHGIGLWLGLWGQ